MISSGRYGGFKWLNSSCTLVSPELAIGVEPMVREVLSHDIKL